MPPGRDMLAAAWQERPEFDLSGHRKSPLVSVGSAVSGPRPAPRPRLARPGGSGGPRARWPARHEPRVGRRRGAMRSSKRGRARQAVGEVPLRGVDAGRQARRLEEAEEGPQLVLDHQAVPVAAAGRCQQHRLAGEIGWPEQVEQMLEEAGVAALVDRARHHERVGADDRLERRPRLRPELADAGRPDQGGRELADVEDDPARIQTTGSLPDDRLDQRPRLRRPGEVARDAHDAANAARHEVRRAHSAATASAPLGAWPRARLGRPSTDTGTSPAIVTRRTTRCWSP